MHIVETLEQWYDIEETLLAGGYSAYQFQYDINHPEGFHVWFWASKKPVVEIMTKNQKVCDAIFKYRD